MEHAGWGRDARERARVSSCGGEQHVTRGSILYRGSSPRFPAGSSVVFSFMQRLRPFAANGSVPEGLRVDAERGHNRGRLCGGPSPRAPTFWFRRDYFPWHAYKSRFPADNVLRDRVCVVVVIHRRRAHVLRLCVIMRKMSGILFVAREINRKQMRCLRVCRKQM